MATGKQNLSSEEIKNNFKNIKSDRYIHIKVLAILFILLIGCLLFVLFKSCNRPLQKAKISILAEKNDSTIQDSAESKPLMSAKKVFPITIYANSTQDLREKLLRISSKRLLSGEFTPVNANFNISNNVFYCEFVEDSSQFIKLSLVWGPKSTGCESCANTLIKNPGSRILLHEEDAQFIYEVIAISK